MHVLEAVAIILLFLGVTEWGCNNRSSISCLLRCCYLSHQHWIVTFTLSFHAWFFYHAQKLPFIKNLVILLFLYHASITWFLLYLYVCWLPSMAFSDTGMLARDKVNKSYEAYYNSLGPDFTTPSCYSFSAMLPASYTLIFLRSSWKKRLFFSIILVLFNIPKEGQCLWKEDRAYFFGCIHPNHGRTCSTLTFISLIIFFKPKSQSTVPFSPW